MESNSMLKYRAVGVMSGTSLDGVDVTLCCFRLTNSGWEYDIEQGKTYSYPPVLFDELSNAMALSSLDLAHLNNALSEFWSACVKELIGDEQVDFVSVHGQTVFHQPNKGLTVQLVNASMMAARLQLPVISDFRTADVALGGQGAPLVPIGDMLLFGQYAACVNLGGFCNVSMSQSEKFIAFDVAVANLLLNHLAKEKGLKYDHDGAIAERGLINNEVLTRLHGLPYFEKSPPKSLGVEWLKAHFLPLWNELTEGMGLEDRMATACAHIADQLSRSLNATEGEILVTGGGALNPFLMKQIELRLTSKATIAKANNDLIEFKEALVFAFLGVLKWRGEVNVLSSVTGSKMDHSAGQIAYP